MYKQLTGGEKATSGVVLEISMVLSDAVMELVCVFQCGSSFADLRLSVYINLRHFHPRFFFSTSRSIPSILFGSMILSHNMSVNKTIQHPCRQ